MDFCLLILIAVAVWFLKMTSFSPWRHVGIPGLIAGTHCRASRTPAGGGWWLWWQCGVLSCDGRCAMCHPGGMTSGSWGLLQWCLEFRSRESSLDTEVWILDASIFWRIRKHLNWMFLPVRCYITVTLLKLDFLLRFHIISSKLTKIQAEKLLAFVSQVFRPKAMEGETRLVFPYESTGVFHAFGVWCMHPSGHSATFVGGRMFMFGGCQVTGLSFKR